MAISVRYVPIEDAEKHNHYKGTLAVGTNCAIGDIWNYNGVDLECYKAVTVTADMLAEVGSLAATRRVYNEPAVETPDGSQTTFTFSNSIVVGTEEVYWNGQVQTRTTDYSVSGSTIIFVNPPSAGIVTCSYNY